jgi:hypothetical protein
MKATKAVSLYVAAALGVRITNHQLNALVHSPGSTQRLDEQAQRQAEMLGTSGKCPLFMPLRKHSYNELAS